MQEKKIAECVKILINLGNYQNIEIAKYAEKVITYETPEEMVEKEDGLTTELVNNIIRNMKRIPDQLGKKTDAPKDVEDRIKKSIPEWLTVAPIPNIANSAKKMQVEAAAKTQESVDDNSEWTIETITQAPSETSIVKEQSNPEIKIEEATGDVEQPSADNDNEDIDLFGNDDDLFK